MTHETHKHHFQVADIGDWDLDQDRSIVPSIHSPKETGHRGSGGRRRDELGFIHRLDLLTQSGGRRGLEGRWYRIRRLTIF